MSIKYPDIPFYQPVNGSTLSLTQHELDLTVQAVRDLALVFDLSHREMLEALARFMTEAEFEYVLSDLYQDCL